MHAITGRSGKRLKIGTSVDRAGTQFSRNVDMARRLEDAGFDFLTLGDNGAETFGLAGAVAYATSSIRIASSIATWTRTPATMAHSAMTVHNISGGRFDLGIGPAPKMWIEGWHGMAFDPVLPRMREYLLALRACLDATPDSPTDVDGQYYPTHGYDGWGIVVDEPVSLHLAVTQPKMTELAGEVADGAMVNIVPPFEWVADNLGRYLQTGMDRKTRDPDRPFEVEIGRFIGVHPDRATAYDLARKQISFYFKIPYFRTLLEPYGFGPDIDAGQEAIARGDERATVAAVSDRLVEAIGIAGTPDEVYAKIEAYAPYVDAINLAGGMTLPPDVAEEHIGRILEVCGPD